MTSGDNGDELSAYYYDYSDYYDQEEIVEEVVAHGIYTYTAPLLLLLGTLGNGFSVVIMLHLSQQVFSSCIYLALLAVVDALVLFTRCGNNWLQNIAHVDLSNELMVSSESICKVYPFVFNFIFHLAKWLLVSVAIEGFIATKYPEKVATMCTRSRAKAVILFLTVLLICVNIHYFWSFEIVTFSHFGYVKVSYCTFAKHGHEHSEVFQQVIWPVLNLLVAEVIPYFVIIGCGIAMVVRMATGKHRGDEAHQQWRKRYELNPEAMDELKVTVLVICGLYLLLTLPKFTFSIFKYIAETYHLVDDSMEFQAQQALAHSICDTLEYIFLSLKFFIYFATSQRFRIKCFKIVHRCSCLCKGRRCGDIFHTTKHLSSHPCHVTATDNLVTAAEDGNHVLMEREHDAINKDHLTMDSDHLTLQRKILTIRGDHGAMHGDHVMTNADHMVMSRPHEVFDSDHVALNRDHVTIECGHVTGMQTNALEQYPCVDVLRSYHTNNSYTDDYDMSLNLIPKQTITTV